MVTKRVIIWLILALLGGGVPQAVRAVEAAPSEQAPDSGVYVITDTVTVVKGKVLEVLETGNDYLVGTPTQAQFQTIEAEIVEGPETGKRVTIKNDYLQLEVGETFFINHTVRGDTGTETYTVFDPYRLPALVWLIILFLIVVIAFGGIQGIRGLISLVGSFALIIYILLPSILQGYPPLIMSVLVSSLIIVLGSYVTHGFTKTTSSAVIGMVLTVIFTGILAYFSVEGAQLSGFEADESVYLNIASAGIIDMKGLFLGGIIIGLLGVLYDAAIGQSVAVDELHRVAPHLPRRTIYARALRIGREHIGALVNTLAIAYAGASLPLMLLLLTVSEMPVVNMLNKEVFAAEIVRTLVGSIGLVLTVPITTLIAVAMLVHPKKLDASPDEAQHVLEHEQHALESVEGGCGHVHHHK